jgi:DmsE family decaheme c-type cytochrome
MACAGLFLGGGRPALGELPAQPQTRTSTVCFDCHENAQGSLKGSPHHIASEAVDGSRPLVSCTDCHGSDERHWEEDPAAYPMTNPAKAPAAMTAQICGTCHLNSHQQNMREGNPHSLNNVSCTGCHQVHGSPAAPLLHKAQPDLCYDCHAGVRGQFAKPYRHPISDGVMTCSECHMVTAERQQALSYAGANAACVSCHNEFQGPFPYEHQATVDYSTEEGGCLNCHNPHGGNFPRMLRRPYEAPHFNLCTQCHAVPKHNFNRNHGSAWAGVACNECHVDIHGSYANRLFLSRALQAQGCLAAGCHQE